MEALTDDELVSHLRRMKEIDDYDDECESCQKPSLLHAGACVRSEIVDDDELAGIWKEFRLRMKSLTRLIRAEREQYLKEAEITKNWKATMLQMNEWNCENIERFCAVLVRNREENAKQPSKVIKPAKVPVWSKEMSMETYEK